MRWIFVIVSLFLLTGCNEKKVIQNENNQKVDFENQDKVENSNEQISSELQEPSSSSEVSNLETGNSSTMEEYSNKDFSNMNVQPESIPVAVKEEQTVQQIDSLEQEVTMLLSSEKVESVKEVIATKFITLVDFIYYEEPIGDVYFKDLTQAAQEKIRAILTRMDTAIESKIPNYKDTLQAKYQSALHYVKTGVENITNKVSEKLESTMGSDNYQNFVDAKDDMVESFQNTGKIIKEGASHVYQSGKEKVSNWYQGLKEKYEK